MVHLESVVRQSGGRIIPPELASRTPKPERAMYLWNYFARLSSEREYDGFSGAPRRLRSSDVLAWCTLNRVRLETFEVDLITALDESFVETKTRELAAEQKQEKPKRGESK